MRIVNKLVSKLPQGAGEFSTSCYSYVTQSDDERLIKDQKAHQSHRDLRNSHDKIRKKNKKIGKFFQSHMERSEGLMEGTESRRETSFSQSRY